MFAQIIIFPKTKPNTRQVLDRHSLDIELFTNNLKRLGTTLIHRRYEIKEGVFTLHLKTNYLDVEYEGVGQSGENWLTAHRNALEDLHARCIRTLIKECGCPDGAA